MKIECPETESTMELSDCNCGPKCEHYYDTKQHRIDELESAMQEFYDKMKGYKADGVHGMALEAWLVLIKQLLDDSK